jgi:DNA (cytosine-5)-methyltransferase 3A
MNVLSLFDGISCGRVALERAGIKINNYYASEIDKYAIQIAKKNYPNTKHIGNVVDVKASDLSKIDLLIGGSPCQGFSFAGKQLNFEDERSKLFFEYVRLLEECEPSYFLLENVKMKKEYQDIISNYLGVEPILINSSLVSAQSRDRLYWTNIPNIMQPQDKGLVLKDILEDGAITYKTKSYALTLSNHSGTIRDFFLKSQSNIVFIEDGKGSLKVKDGFVYFNLPKSKEPQKTHKIKCGLKDGTYTFRKLKTTESEKLQTLPVGYTSCVSYTDATNTLGNCWTVDVIAHIFKGLKDDSIKTS